ncbi:hypothetical protein DFH11DRAFT_1549085 [Phellopilus nigrolimitatus]|nr:hypothetical protein DFH11DRAFT_1549085 [Phellopilus nigrolimitatus]
MNVDEASSSASPAGDISPITGTSEGKALESKKCKSEPSFKTLPNFTCAIPAQLAHITFPAEGCFQPVHPVSTRTPKTTKGKASTVSAVKAPSLVPLGVTSERYTGGGRILILINQSLDEPAEYIEAELPVLVPAVEAAASPAPGATVSA